MPEKIQIIGKVTGLDRAECVKKFKDTQDELEAAGYKVVNPVELIPEDSTWSDAMRMCLRELLTADAVAVHPDWNLSRGASIEYLVAVGLQLKVIMV
jgi:predicted type IV restriction endonuclease